VSIHNCRRIGCPAATLPPLRRFASLAVGRVLVLLGCLALSVPAHAQKVSPIRPPAVPLIVRTPYVSTWQPSTDLAGTWPSFWDGGTKAITGIARIDGRPYLFLGNPQIP